jgi:hypothetical protein
MAISNYTTDVKVSKTVGEIHDILANHDAQKIMTTYENKQPVGISFIYVVNGNEVGFNLPANHAGVLRAMFNDVGVPQKYCNEDQARRVAWRTVLYWIEAQMAMVEAEQAEMLQVFLPYAVMKSGQTHYEDLKSNNFLKLDN